MLALVKLLFLILIVQRIDARIFPVSSQPGYQWTYRQAHDACFEKGATLASPAEIEEARQQGKSHCNCGWLSDKTARYPMAEVHGACGGAAKVHSCGWRSTWNAFCYMGPVENCSQALGMEFGRIMDGQITASSAYHTFWNERWGPNLARLNRDGIVNAWMPHHDDRNQYIEVNLESPKAITAIMTQGVIRYTRPQFVSKFTVSYSKDGDYWVKYLNGDEPMIFDANSDNEGHVRNEFPEAILAQYIRIYPYSWHQHISLRFELFGCSIEQHRTSNDNMRSDEDEPSVVLN